MKVAIITITDGSNYGNRLQNYALQTVIKKIGIEEVETFQRKNHRNKTLYQKMRSYVKNLLFFFMHRPTDRAFNARKKAFDKFNKAYITFSPYCLSFNRAPKGMNNKYDYFICGSDQIWNTRFRVISDDICNYLAGFADSEKRISYAASFGTDNVEEKFVSVFSDELQKFKAISVREISGISLVKELSGKDAEVVLDPTMLLDVKEWQKIIRKPDYIGDESFILTYFMSGRNEKIQAYIDQLKDKSDIGRVVHLEMEFIRNEEITDEKVFCTTPDEFLWLIQNAKCVLTDSFHATVFSILFHKPFIVFERKAVEQENDMSSRIDTLLRHFGLERFRDDINNPTMLPEVYDADQVEAVLQQERFHSYQFLEQALR